MNWFKDWIANDERAKQIAKENKENERLIAKKEAERQYNSLSLGTDAEGQKANMTEEAIAAKALVEQEYARLGEHVQSYHPSIQIHQGASGSWLVWCEPGDGTDYAPEQPGWDAVFMGGIRNIVVWTQKGRIRLNGEVRYTTLEARTDFFGRGEEADFYYYDPRRGWVLEKDLNERWKTETETIDRHGGKFYPVRPYSFVRQFSVCYGGTWAAEMSRIQIHQVSGVTRTISIHPDRLGVFYTQMMSMWMEWRHDQDEAFLVELHRDVQEKIPRELQRI